MITKDCFLLLFLSIFFSHTLTSTTLAHNIHIYRLQIRVDFTCTSLLGDFMLCVREGGLCSYM